MTNLAQFNHKIPLANRSILAISCSSILFGSISVPYCYIATGALSHFKPTVTLIVVPWLVICTLFLFVVFISTSKLEQRLANKLGAHFYPLFIVMVVLALGSSYFIESIIANFTLFLPVEYWFLPDPHFRNCIGGCFCHRDCHTAFAVGEFHRFQAAPEQ